jgi:hypothetical protein
MNIHSLANSLIKDIIGEDKIPGGLSTGKTLEDFYKHHDPKKYQGFEDYKKIFKNKLNQGIDVEMEHTTSKLIAKEIAMDHLWEDLYYYDKIKKIEIKENNHNTLDDYINSLSQFMISKGLPIEPLPRVEFVDNDIDNAKNILGKTAHYEPDNKTILLYTLNRHPKDILRSYSHELIHHAQNMQNRIHDINTTNINNDEYLFKLEEEAYLLGNMVFRSWENSFK